MKTLNELYQILKVNLPSQDTNFYICNEIKALWENSLITDKEYDKLFKHFKNERPSPTKHVKFYNHENYTKELIYDAWWRFDGEQRHLFVDKLIRISAKRIKKQKEK